MLSGSSHCAFIGMEWAFGYFLGCLLPQMWKWHMMRQAHWALGHITIIMSGSVVLGCLHRQTSLSLTRNCFLRWCLPKYGVPSGFGDTFFSAQIRRLLYTSWLPGRRRSNALCVFSAIHSLLLLSLTLLSLHSISPAFMTTLLMLFPTFIAGLQAFGTHGTAWPSSNRSSTQGTLDPSSIEL